MPVYRGIGIIFLGIVVVLVGLSMPETVQVTGTSCVTDAWGYQHCAEATGSRENTMRYFVLGVGVLTFVAGIFLMDKE